MRPDTATEEDDQVAVQPADRGRAGTSVKGSCLRSDFLVQPCREPFATVASRHAGIRAVSTRPTMPGALRFFSMAWLRKVRWRRRGARRNMCPEMLDLRSNHLN